MESSCYPKGSSSLYFPQLFEILDNRCSLEKPQLEAIKYNGENVCSVVEKGCYARVP